MMDLYDVLDQIVDLLRQRKRLTYRLLQRQFALDDETLKDLKDELIKAQRVAVDEEDSVLVWRGEAEETPVSVAPLDPPEQQPTTMEEPSPQVESPPANIPEAERRQLTILFTDLVDSTKLSGQHDAEDYREIVRAYQASCAEVIERFDCNLAQTLGDGLLIYSGYPVAHENDAERAVRVGLGILDAMQALNEHLEHAKDIRLGVRVAIHTGTVVVGEVSAGSRQEQLALGEVPNVAARIQGLAEPDTVIISAATHQLVEGYFDCEPLGERTLRGVTDPIAVYRVLGESGAQSRLDIVSARGRTPLVGREAEMTLLLDRWTQVKDGAGQVVVLSGEPGIGKTKLAQTLKDHVAEEPHTRWECRSSPYYENTALYPLIDLIQRTLQWHQDDTPEVRLTKLEQQLRQYRLPLEESVPLFAPLLSLPIPEDRYPPLNFSPQRQRQKTLETIVALLLEQAEQQPALFILEDAHWLDASTQEVLTLLIDQAPTSPILTLITYRPEFQPTWGNRSYLTQVTLNRLPQNQVEQIATQVAGGKTLPDEVIEQLVERTDGVPLYVEEMTKSVLEAGVLKEADGHYELTGPVSSLAIPATLQDSLMSRLDRLVTAKAVAQYASVIGRQFSYELLYAVSQVDEETLQKELSRLVDAELVYQRGIPPQATYIFKHALVSDSAYQSLLRSTRQGYHRRIAEVLEAQFPETAEMQPELLAHHYTEAGLNEQAVVYRYQAGQSANKRSAYIEALAHFNQGLSVLQVLPETSQRDQLELDLQISLGAVLMATSGFAAPEVEHVYTRAHTLCQQAEDSPHLFRVLAGLRRFYLVRGEIPTARALAEQMLALAQKFANREYLLEAHFALSITQYFLGAFPLSYDHAKQGIVLYNPQQHGTLALTYGIDPGVHCLVYAALALWHLGCADQALARSHEALTLAHDLSHPFSLARALNAVATVSWFRRDRHQTQTHAEAGIALCGEHGFALILASNNVLRGWALTVQGEAGEGLVQMQQGIADTRATGSQGGMFIPTLVEGYQKAYKLEEGLRALAEALAEIRTTGMETVEAELHRLKGELLLQQSTDNHTEAESCFQRALTVAQNQQAKSLELRAATNLARLWHSQGKRDEACDLLAPVYHWFTEGFDTADLIDAKALLDELSEGR